MHTRPVRIGEILVHMGVLTLDQCDRVLELQQIEGGPFGKLAEDLFGVPPEAVERAWAEQFAQLTGRIDPMELTPDPAALALVEPRQAWQFGVLPVSLAHGEARLCSTQSALPRALRFSGWGIPHDCSFLVACDERAFQHALTRWYPQGVGLCPGGRALAQPRGGADSARA